MTDKMSPVTFFHNPQLLIRVHPSLRTKLNAAEGYQVVCRYGLLSARAPILFDPLLPVNQVSLSTGLAHGLRLEVLDSISAVTQGDSIIVGPLLGILCNPIWKNGSLRRNMQTQSLEKLLEAGKALGAVCCLFGVDDIDFKRSTTVAYVKRGSNWRRVVVPLPAAVYDQLISRKLERKAEHKSKRANLTSIYGTRIFNDGFFDKWEVHEWLSQDGRLKAHLPSTIRYAGTHSTSGFLLQHGTAFLKPVHGSLGLGILRVTKQPDGSATFEVKRQNQAPLHRRTGNTSEVLELLRKRINKRPYLVQQGITLATYQDRPFDIRILLQRDGNGDWKRTKMFARVAKTGDFTSNLSSGGEALPVSDVLSGVISLQAQRRRCLQQIRRVARLVTEVMEKQSHKSFGELGLDIGVDTNGHVWIIEVNSKPWKSPVTEKGRQDLVDLAYNRPMAYLSRLALMN